jgi:hypothetical protein
LEVLNQVRLGAVEFEKTVDQGAQVKEREKDVERQTRVGIILVPFFFDKGDGLHGQKNPGCKKKWDNAEETDEETIRPVILFSVEHVKRSESRAEERHEES